MLDANFRAGEIAAHVTGSGPSIVFLHSLLSDRGSLEPILPMLRDDYRLVLFDLPGFGGSGACSGGLIPLVDRIADGIRIACGNEAPLLFGNGYGAFLALALAARHRDAVSGLFLAGCGAVFSEQGREAFRIMSSKAKQGGLSAISDIAMRRLFTPEMATRFPDVVAERRASFIATNPEIFAAACEILATLDLRAEASKLTVPLLACAGSLDEATPPLMAEELAALAPNGSCSIIHDCAHVPTLQAPEKVAQTLFRFAEQLK
jgi:3-oxoadipate enol-lactonase